MTIETNDSDRAPVPSLPFNHADAIAPDDFVDADSDPPSGSATPPSSSALHDIVPAPRSDERPRERGPGGDERPYFTGATFLAALKYVLVACPKPKREDDSSLLAYVVFSVDRERRRLSLTACDTTRYHQAFVAADPAFAWLRTFRISREDCIVLQRLLETAEKVGSYCCIRPVRGDGFGAEGWEISYGEALPIQTECMPAPAHENWEPPKFGTGLPAVGAIHDARNVAKAMTISLESTRVMRDEVDSAGRRHVTIGDEFGNEVARAVLLNVGFTEGEPESPQREIPGALGAPDRKRTAAPPERATAKSPRPTAVKTAAKSKPAAKSKAKKRGR